MGGGVGGGGAAGDGRVAALVVEQEEQLLPHEVAEQLRKPLQHRGELRLGRSEA